jgi:hypothetical protein
MPVASLNLPDSPWYWAFVAAITVAFALVDLEALRDRRFSRWHGVSVALYVGAWLIVAGVGLPVGRSPGWGVFPAALRVAVIAVFVGGQFLAEAIRGEQRLAHRKRRTPHER